MANSIDQFLVDIGVLHSPPTFWQQVSGSGPASSLWMDRIIYCTILFMLSCVGALITCVLLYMESKQWNQSRTLTDANNVVVVSDHKHHMYAMC